MFFFLGLSIGSFLNVVVYRLPRGQGVITGRSRCPVCGHILAWYDLVPVISYTALRGRCRYCKVPIAPRYCVVELMTGALFVLLWLRWGPTLVLVKYLYLGSIVIAAAFIRLDGHRVPGSLLLAGALGGTTVGLAAGDVTALSAVVGGAAGIVVAMTARKVLGGPWMLDDALLVGVLGTFLGWPWVGIALLCAAAGWGVATLACVLIKGKPIDMAIPPSVFFGFATIAVALWRIP
ncbi:MAG: prepilin peptidase [Bacillota bacterium]